MQNPHIALLGDSIFDNAVYTAGAPDVVTHLRAGLPKGWRASLLAVDGSTTRDVASQVARVAADVTHIVLSIGGNDALGNLDLLTLPVRSTAEALHIFGERAAAFRASYRSALDAVLALKRRTTVCTIYEGNLEPPAGELARVALMLFNDAILRTALERGVGVIDLRLICTQPADYANPIEPSGIGGAKIAAAILSAIGVRER
jgi:GDSL-like lipase/acylhydrolase family protein